MYHYMSIDFLGCLLFMIVVEGFYINYAERYDNSQGRVLFLVD